jgi:hypothetical protein
MTNCIDGIIFLNEYNPNRNKCFTLLKYVMTIFNVTMYE